MSQRERAPGGGTRLTVDRAYRARGRDAAGRWRRAGGSGGGGPPPSPPPGAREPAGRERRSRRAHRAHSRRAPSHPAASERDGLTDPAPAGPGQRRRRRGEAGEDTHTSPPPTRADPQQPGGGARARDGAPDRSRRGWHSRPAHTLTRGGGRAETRAPLHRGGGRAVAGQPTTDKPGPAPRPGARARAGGGGGTAEEGDGRSPPRLHTTPPPGRTVAADTERRPQRAREAPTHQSAPPGLVAERRRPRHGRLAARATRRRQRATGNRTAGQRQGSPTGLQTRRLEGAEPSRHRGAHGVPPPEASSTRAVPWHPRTPTRPAPLGEPWGKPSQRALRGPATRSSRATGPWNALPHARRPTTRAPPQPDPRRAQPAPLSLFFPPFLHSHEWGRQHSARDPAPQEPWRPKGGAGTRQTARPGLGPDTVTGEGEEKGRTRRSVVQAETGKQKQHRTGGGPEAAGRGAHARSEDQRARARRRARARGRARQRRREPGHRVNVRGIPPPPARGRSRDARGASRPQHP